ncbi:hypothetical protein J4457_00475 [Candidatus Woesearchaeota archaeon]|nr:hypothetical protein [Candidatus Woesearchaeota archaeon]
MSEGSKMMHYWITIFCILFLVACTTPEVKKGPVEYLKVATPDAVQGAEVIGTSEDLSKIAKVPINTKSYMIEGGSKNRFIIGPRSWDLEVLNVRDQDVDLIIEDKEYKNIELGKIITLNDQTYFKVEEVYRNQPNPEQKNMVSFYLMNSADAIRSTLYEEQVKTFDFEGQKVKVKAVYVGGDSIPVAKFAVNGESIDALKVGQSVRINKNIEIGVIDIYESKDRKEPPSDFVRFGLYFNPSPSSP